MADETATDPEIIPVVEPEKPVEISAAARLRAFEDKHLGEKTSRINGEIERGIGSPYTKMNEDHRAKHMALEKLVAAEKRLADAKDALAAAEAACQIARVAAI